jgi:hypothetical protein
MRAKIQKNLKKQFIPFFSTVIMGKPTKVSLKDAESNPEKYINTAIGPLYEDYKALKVQLKKRTKKEAPLVLDMRQAERGFVFDKNHKSKKDQDIEKFLEKSEKLRGKIKLSVDRQLKEKEENKKATEKAVKAAVAKEKKKAKEAEKAG